jgi:hypothetical protein
MEPSNEIVNACSAFAGGFLAEGTESFVTVGSDSKTAMQVQTVATPPTGEPKDAVLDVANATGIPFEKIEIQVYVMCGGARGADL